MKRVIIFFVVLLAAVWLGITIHNNPGYVLLAFKNWTIETSFWFALIALIILFFCFSLLLRISSGIAAVFYTVGGWFSKRKQRKARSRTIEGLYALVEGNWKVAEHKFTHAAKFSDMPLINYLAAALMAQKQNSYHRSEIYLREAQKIAKHHAPAVSLTQARLQIINKKWEQAFATLQHLRQMQPKNILALELLQKVCLELHDWNTLRDIIPLLRKFHVLATEEINQLEVQTWLALLEHNIDSRHIEVLWEQLPSYLQKDQSLLRIYGKYLVKQNKFEEAENLLKLSLRKKLDEKLLDFYCSLESSNPLKKLTRAESWLETNPNNAHLLLSLGRICKKLKLWGKAIMYLEKSAKIAPSQTVYYELGQIMEEQNDTKMAMEYYKKAILLSH